MPAWRCICVECVVFQQKEYAEDGIRTRASEEIGALNRRLRPTRPPPQWISHGSTRILSSEVGGGEFVNLVRLTEIQ